MNMSRLGIAFTPRPSAPVNSSETYSCLLAPTPAKPNLNSRPSICRKSLAPPRKKCALSQKPKASTSPSKPLSPVPSKAHAEALRRVLCILLDNAIKFTPAGSVSISVSQQTVVISDTGIGIPAAEIPKIFERFYRISKDRSRATGGAGLGLSIAHWIIARHGGQIKVESTPQKGSTFSVILP